MKLVVKITLILALFTLGLCSVGIRRADAAVAHIDYLTSTHAYTTQGSPYNMVFFDYTLSWTGTNRFGIAELDWYQNGYTGILMTGYFSSPGEVVGSKQDIFRPSGVNNFYQLLVKVIDTMYPDIVYAWDIKASFPN